MKRLNADAALVLFSGGQDSAIALAYALDRYARVETVGFDYGQRHAAELTAREDLRSAFVKAFPSWADKLGPDCVLTLGAFREIGEDALTSDADIGVGDDGLPTTFVPGRNLMFFAAAAALAYRRDIGALIGGMCETDFSGYPDCRAETLEAQLQALRLGMDANFTMETPLMRLSKAASWRLAEQIGGAALVEIIRVSSHTCYRGVREHLHDWGYGCGECPACALRAAGWRAYAGGAR